MGSDLINRAHLGDLDGMHLAGLVRLSFELDVDGSAGKVLPLTGRDIKGRDQQTQQCRTYVERRGGAYVFTYEEPDTSAYKRRRVRLPDGRIGYRVVRPVLEAALADLRRGTTPDGQRLDGLVVYDIDRLTRDNRDLEDAIEVVQHFGRPILDITGTLDLLTDNGRTVARIVVATANKQSADTARRVTAKHRAMEQAGIPTGGARPFGWQADKRTLDEAEAAAIREGAQRLMRGAPIGAIVVDWNRRGLLTPLGNKWVQQTVKTMLRNPRLCGYRSRLDRGIDKDTDREYRRWEIVRKESGEPVIGQWEPILTVAEWEAVTALIGAHGISSRGQNALRYLLSGILRCGNDGCGAKIRAFRKPRKKDPDNFNYGCPSTALGGCGGSAISGPVADALIAEAVIAKFELEAERRGAVSSPVEWPKAPELEAVRQQLAEMTAAWRAREMSGARYFALLPGLEQEERDLKAEHDAWLAATAVAVNRPLTIRADWESGTLTFPEKRAYVEEALVAVVLEPAKRRADARPEDRLHPVWREE